MTGETGKVVFTLDETIEKIQGSSSLRKIKVYLDKTDLSADLKALLYDIAKITVKVGEVVLAVGRRALDIAMLLVKKVPNTTLGFVLALVLSTIISGGPFPGLAAALSKLLFLLGITAGAIEDIRQNAMREAMDRVASQFAPLQTVR